MSHEHHFKIAKVEKLPDSEAQITGEIALPFLLECRKEALKLLNNSVSLPGFRSGKIPEDVLVKNIGEMKVLEETAEVALANQYGHIVEEAKLRPIARPMISVTKLAPGIPLEFKMNLILEPEFDLPDYKKLAKEVKEEDKEKRRLKIIETLTKETTLEIPKKLVDAELMHMLMHFRSDVEKAGAKWDEYLERIKKTEEEVRESWRENIVIRAKTELILTKIAQNENLKTYAEVFELLEG